MSDIVDHRPVRDNDFGQRYLDDSEAVFEHNAWDDVDFPPEQEIIVAETIERQRAAKVDESRAEDLIKEPVKRWNEFYTKHQSKFFMDRNWLTREAPELFSGGSETQKLKVYDVGCGVGNTTFPLLEANPNLDITCSDYSSTAIDLVKAHPTFLANSHRCQAFVWDITQPNPEIPDGSMDFVLCIYVLSALPPESHATAIANLGRLLKPGGFLMIKDYGRHDLTQLRFKKGRFISENFYCRGDDTLVYFFTAEELHGLLTTSGGLQKVENFVDKRLIVNRAKQVKMYRRWLQCKYVKPE